MTNLAILKTGIAGFTITALCCFTPALVILLGAAGLSAWLGWLDFLLFPALVIFLGMTAYGLWRHRRATRCCGTAVPTARERP